MNSLNNASIIAHSISKNEKTFAEFYISVIIVFFQT